ncbi:NADPH-dependent glutamate synthase [Bacillota bacterium]
MVKVKQELQWVKQEARRCLYCLDGPCAKGCPASIDVPQFIRHLRYGNTQSAKEVIMTANPLGSICGILCPSEKLCEKKCVLNSKLEAPIHIRDLQRFACENGEYGRTAAVKNDKKVAIVGAGPAGLACAAELASIGYNVDIFEKSDGPGGVVESEIPGHRIDKEAIEKDIRDLIGAGIQINYNKEVKEEDLEKYMADYDAIFLGIGLNQDKNTGVELETNKNVWGSSAFLQGVKAGRITPPEGTTIVIGGGDSAMDVATTSMLNGAEKVILAYRRTKKEMPATKEEFLYAVDMGVELMYLVSPVSIKENNHRLQVTFVKNRILKAEVEGRQAFEVIKNSEFTVLADTVVFATGKSSNYALDEKADSNTLRIKDTNCFSGGDFLNKGGTIVQAVMDGKKAAHEIDKYLFAEKDK